jgi:CRISPR-associated protein Csm1
MVSTKTKKTRFSLFGIEKESQRHVHIIYSGGDDMFLVGAWDDLIELAVDIRRDFAQFTNGKLTFSAGIGFFHHACPISQMARVTGELEDLAKAYPGKDSIMLFGTETNEGSIRGVLRNEPYSWNVFIHKVCEEKLSFWQAHFQQTEESDAKLNIGKSSIYRLMNLLDTPDGSTSINLARFAYVLGRMEPDKSHATQARMACYQEVRQQFYEWYKQTEDRRELQTAIQLVVYQLRESEG